MCVFARSECVCSEVCVCIVNVRVCILRIPGNCQKVKLETVFMTVRLNLFAISSVYSEHKTHPNIFGMGYKSCSRPQ